jgi:hypothetical protein
MAIRFVPFRQARPRRSLLRSAVLLGSACVMLGGCGLWMDGSGLPIDGRRHIPTGFKSDAKQRAFYKQVDDDPLPRAEESGV